MQLRADKGMNLYGNMYLAGFLYGTSATFTNVVTCAGLRIGSTGTTMPLDVDNGAVIRTENDCWNSEEIAVRICRGNRTGIAEQHHQIVSKIHNSSVANVYLKFRVHEFGGAASTDVVDVLTLFGDQSAKVDGALSALSYTTTSDERVKGDVQAVDLSPIFDAVECKSYDRIDKPSLGRRCGFIAQHLRSAANAAGLPDTYTAPLTGTDLLGLDYGRLTTVLWSVCKRQQAALAALEARLRTIEIAIESAK